MAQPGAKNLGAAVARSKWVMFLDADTTIEPEPLAQLVRTLRSPSFGSFGGPGQPSSSSRNRAYFFARDEREPGKHSKYPIHPSAMIATRESFWKQMGGFEEDLR